MTQTHAYSVLLHIMQYYPWITCEQVRVIVSTAKKSTVPKSEIVSINTNDNPATIAGLARGKETK